MVIVLALCSNLSKCEVFWLSGDQCFLEFLSTVKHVTFSDTSGPVFLGSPIWGLTSSFASFVKEVVEKVSLLQERLQSLESPQVKLHLLCSCLGMCKLNHLLCTISPDTIMPQLHLFDGYLRDYLYYRFVMHPSLIMPGVRPLCPSLWGV